MKFEKVLRIQISSKPVKNKDLLHLIKREKLYEAPNVANFEVRDFKVLPKLEVESKLVEIEEVTVGSMPLKTLIIMQDTKREFSEKDSQCNIKEPLEIVS